MQLLNLQKTSLCSFANFHPIKVSNLSIVFPSYIDYDHTVNHKSDRKFFQHFQGTNFQSLRIINISESTFEKLKEFRIEADDLEVAFEHFWEPPDPEILPVKPCLLTETGGDMRWIADRCQVGFRRPEDFKLQFSRRSPSSQSATPSEFCIQPRNLSPLPGDN